MLIVMTGLVDLDTASRSLAAAADVTLPELTPAH
jgi:hypothetical protein